MNGICEEARLAGQSLLRLEEQQFKNNVIFKMHLSSTLHISNINL